SVFFAYTVRQIWLPSAEIVVSVMRQRYIMNRRNSMTRYRVYLWAAPLLVVSVLLVTMSLVPGVTGAKSGGFYRQTNLVSDIPGLAAVTDPNLVNSWGLSHGPTTPWWVSDNGTGVATLYKGDG